MRVIRDRIATTYSQQKSYANNRNRPLEFDVGYQVITYEGGDEVWQEGEVESKVCWAI